MNKLFPNVGVLVTKHFDVHQDWETPIPGFFIIAAKTPIKSFGDFTPDQADEFIRLLVKLRQGMKEKLGFEKVHILQNENTEHDFHVWVLPRHAWMEQFGTKTAAIRPIVEYAKERMVTEAVFAEVNRMAAVMKEYMKDFE